MRTILAGVRSVPALQALLARLARLALQGPQGPRALLRKTLAPLVHLARLAQPVAQLDQRGRRAIPAPQEPATLGLQAHWGPRGQGATLAQQGLRAYGVTGALEATKEPRDQ